jgi:hypothetical protein
LETAIMNPRLAALAALCREVAIPASVLAWIIATGSVGIDSTGAAPIVEHPAPSLVAVANTTVAKLADRLPPIALATAAVPAVSEPVTKVTVADATPAWHEAEVTPALHEPEPIVTAALTDSSELLPPETSPDQVAKPDQAVEISPATRKPGNANPALDSTEVLDECLVADNCVDRYLWALYQRTPKEDSIRSRNGEK